VLRVLILIFLVFLCEIIHSQICVFQDTWRGSVKCTGFSVGATAAGSEIVDLSIPSGSEIKKIYLLTYSLFDPDSTLISINGVNIEWDKLFKISEVYYPLYFTNYKIHLSDVTNIISTNTLTNTLVEIRNSCGIITAGCGFFGAHFFVLSNNSSDSLINFSLNVPNQPVIDSENYQISNLNPVNTAHETAFSVYLDRSLELIEDGSFIRINGSLLGYVYGEDIQNVNYLLSGVQGNFEYRNNIISGLNDDLPDFQMDHHDALSNISSILPNNTTNFILEIKHFYPNAPSWANNHLAFPLAYSTPCQPQNVTVTPDTTICPNSQVQLSATGGTSSGTAPAYEWWPQKDLSCYDCPNPIFSGDSSQFYTVRIWGSDSCSVVRPIMIHVRTKPKTTFYNQSNSLCADSTAFVNWQTAGANTYSLDNGAFQPAGFYNQLPAGEHLLTVRDAFGCTYDTLVLIDDYSSVVANLSVSPLSGEAPLVVQITNQSTEFTDYSWSVNNTIQPNASNSFEAFTAGEYTVQLIAWQNDPTCADTAFQTISVTSAGFYIIGSSLVSAGSNAQNTFSVLTNGTPIVKVNLYDAQGRLLKTKTNLQLTAGSNTIWSASELSDIASEMVLYRIEWQNAAESGELKGKVLFLK
jgi:PKD repeat protein